MLKDYFAYSKPERRISIALVVLIVLCAIVFVRLSKNNAKELDRPALQNFEREVQAFEASQFSISKTYKFHDKYVSHQPIRFSLFFFDPNQIDSASFLRLGLKPYMAKSILKYRKKGGRFRTSDDFSRVPFLSQEQFLKLKPYICIDEKLIVKRDTLVSKTPSFIRQEKYIEGTLVDLATADTSELKKIPGVASGIARAIVGYRNRLGGFYSINQLKELKNLSEEQFTKISKFLKLGEPKINRISVNRCGFEHLRSHPYLNFYQAKAIHELRKKRGKINSLTEFSLLEEFTEKDFDRLKYYLDFSL